MDIHEYVNIITIKKRCNMIIMMYLPNVDVIAKGSTRLVDVVGESTKGLDDLVVGSILE